MGTWQTGQLDTGLRCFDLLCSGKCDLNEKEQRLIVEAADKIPNLMAVNKDGKIIFANPRPSATIRAPKGHQGWVRIELTKITPQTSEAEKYLCLGVKKNSEHLTQLYKPDYAEEYVGVGDDDVVKLVPMLSKTDLTNEYTPALAGEEVNFENFDVSQMASFDFGSVYRISLDFIPYTGDILWLERQCNLTNIEESSWGDIGSLGVGPVDGKDNQMLTISNTGKLASSSDGIHWKKLDSEIDNGPFGGSKYGNGRWCAVDYNSNNHWYSTDEAKNFSKATKTNSGATRCFAFGDGMFMYVNVNKRWKRYVAVSVTDPSAVYVSVDGIDWNKIGTVPEEQLEPVRSLCYGNGKWLATSGDGYSFISENGTDWTPLGNQLANIGGPEWYGGTFTHGYFYVIKENGGIVTRSSDGEKWEAITEPKNDMYRSVTFYKNKLYTINSSGTRCDIGLFWPSNLID